MGLQYGPTSSGFAGNIDGSLIGTRQDLCYKELCPRLTLQCYYCARMLWMTRWRMRRTSTVCGDCLSMAIMRVPDILVQIRIRVPI